MSTLVTKQGIANIAADLSQRHVLAELLGRLIKGDGESITPSKLAAEICVGTPEVLTALEALEHEEIINLGTEWQKVGSFRIEGITINLSVDQMAMAHTTREANTATSREVSGMDQITLGEDLIRATVLPGRNEDQTLNGWFVLNICRNPGQPGEFLLFDKEMQTAGEAWDWWDAYAACMENDFESDHAFLSWVESIPAVPEGYFKDGEDTLALVNIGPLAFDRLADLAHGELSAEAIIESREMVYAGRGYMQAEDAPEYTEPEAPEEPEEDDPRPIFHELSIYADQKWQPVTCNWVSQGDTDTPVPMDVFTFVPSWADDQEWVKKVVSAKVPTEEEAFKILAKNLAQDHYDKHGGGQA